jgi:hypothetical protein
MSVRADHGEQRKFPSENGLSRRSLSRSAHRHDLGVAVAAITGRPINRSAIALTIAHA